MRRLTVSVSLALTVGACGGPSNSNYTPSGGGVAPLPTPTSISSSEVATSVVSGALNNTSGSLVGWNEPRRSRFDQLLDFLSPVSTAEAAAWTCTGGRLSPVYSGPGMDPYAFTPLSCSITWANGAKGSSDWSGTFAMSYGPSCDDRHALIWNQDAGCSTTRTTATGGNTRTITGPDGNSYAVDHDTNGAGTGWDSTVSPAPANGGVVVTCASGGCDDGATLIINGSHLTATASNSKTSLVVWNHTVSSVASPLTVTGSGTSRLLSGSVTVQHNILMYTATATFNDVGFGDSACCFPTSGSVSATYSKGSVVGKTETLTFSSTCGETTLTDASGATSTLTLEHCL
jgi:hypothetical protein